MSLDTLMLIATFYYKSNFFLQFLKRAPNQISFPLDFKHKITVMHTGSTDETNLQQADTPPPSSPAPTRLRAIAREY